MFARGKTDVLHAVLQQVLVCVELLRGGVGERATGKTFALPIIASTVPGSRQLLCVHVVWVKVLHQNGVVVKNQTVLVEVPL